MYYILVIFIPAVLSVKSTCTMYVALARKQFKFIQAIYYCYCAFRQRTYFLYLFCTYQNPRHSLFMYYNISFSINLCIFCLHLIESKLLCLKFQSHKIFKLLTIYRPYPVLKCESENIQRFTRHRTSSC